MAYSVNWDLESIFSGGSNSTALQEKIALLKEQTSTLHTKIQNWDVATTTVTELLSILKDMELIDAGIEQGLSFTNALSSANVADAKAQIVGASILALMPDYQLAETIFIKKLTAILPEKWEALLADPALQVIAFRLNEMREKGAELLSDNEENIINVLSLDGINAWGTHYDNLVKTIQISHMEKGEEVCLSAGQAFNKMVGDADNDVRQEMFEKWEAAWSENEQLFADTLNHVDGFRLATYKLHNEEDFLKEPLRYNRMKQETLDTMWQTIIDNKQPLVDYMNRKAKLLGKTQLDWQDQEAPLLLGNINEKTYSFDEGAAFVIENFAKFSPKMADFAKMAFEKSWIEAENRNGKRPGAYCTSFPESQASRVFMTYGGAINEVATLAHELGHAFHSSVLWDIPALNRQYAMNVAETASTFAELIVADATLKQAQTKEEKINLLDVKIQSAVAMFMNIHARFIFEQRFYTARKEGLVAPEELSQMMLDAQKEAFNNALGTYHPHFWASKLHFYIDDISFYNFPYTFGYLFSMGIYAHASKKGSSFEDEYIALLRDTASMTTEELAMKHLGVRLTEKAFWQAGIDMILADIHEFMQLTENY